MKQSRRTKIPILNSPYKTPVNFATMRRQAAQKNPLSQCLNGVSPLAQRLLKETRSIRGADIVELPVISNTASLPAAAVSPEAAAG
jgi:hypothetical protein